MSVCVSLSLSLQYILDWSVGGGALVSYGYLAVFCARERDSGSAFSQPKLATRAESRIPRVACGLMENPRAGFTTEIPSVSPFACVPPHTCAYMYICTHMRARDRDTL